MFAYLFRLLLFFVVISVIRSVVQTVVRAFRGTEAPRSGAPAQASQASQASESTLLHQDPVCGTYVPAGSSFRRIVNGQVFHFCSEACRDRYQA
jgi:YHS domain-containing protein